MSKIILTSSSFANPEIMDKAFDWFGNPLNKKVAIITTAAKEKEKNKWNLVTRQEFLDKGFRSVDFFDVEFDNVSRLVDYDIIYVCGGNTFYLLYFLKKSGADKIIKELTLQDEIIYFGTSAGSLILSPTIDLAGTVCADPNKINLDDLSALNIINFDIFPHYSEKYEKELKEYEDKYNKKVVRLRDGQAVFIDDNGQEFV